MLSFGLKYYFYYIAHKKIYLNIFLTINNQVVDLSAHACIQFEIICFNFSDSGKNTTVKTTPIRISGRSVQFHDEDDNDDDYFLDRVVPKRARRDSPSHLKNFSCDELIRAVDGPTIATPTKRPLNRASANVDPISRSESRSGDIIRSEVYMT